MATAPAHRKNKDGTWDSICLGCFMTIAQAASESALKEQERKHICYPLDFSRTVYRPGRDDDSARQ